MRCLLRFVFVCATTFAAATPAAAAGIGGGQWIPPVSGPVLRSFDPPETRFGPGHVGVDFGIAPGTPVHAAGDGVVVFAGRVGAGLHVVVRHPGDIRTTYSFLASATVVVGQQLERGATLGTSGGTGAGHGSGVLHFGVRVGATYVDPMLLFEPIDLAAVVHLAAPHGGLAGPPLSADTTLRSAGERSSLVEALRVDGHPPVPPPPWWADAPHEPRPRPVSRASPRRGATEPTRPASTSSPGPAAAVALAGVALAGVGATRRRRRRRS